MKNLKDAVALVVDKVGLEASSMSFNDEEFEIEICTGGPKYPDLTVGLAFRWYAFRAEARNEIDMEELKQFLHRLQHVMDRASM